MMDDVQGAAAPTAGGVCKLGREITASRPKPLCVLKVESTGVAGRCLRLMLTSFLSSGTHPRRLCTRYAKQVAVASRRMRPTISCWCWPRLLPPARQTGVPRECWLLQNGARRKSKLVCISGGRRQGAGWGSAAGLTATFFETARLHSCLM